MRWLAAHFRRSLGDANFPSGRGHPVRIKIQSDEFAAGSADHGEIIQPVAREIEQVPVRQDAILPALVWVAGAGRARGDHELRCHPAGLGEEAQALLRDEVAVEEAREHPIEGAVIEWQVERVTDDEGGVRRLPAGDLDHRLALVEAHDLAGELPRQEAGPAGGVECPDGLQGAERRAELVQFVVEPGPTLNIIRENVLSDDTDFSASPAVADGKIYLRSQTHLYCIGEKKN